MFLYSQETQKNRKKNNLVTLYHNLKNTDMTTVKIKWIEPKVVSITENQTDGSTTSLSIVLDWYKMGIGIHRVYKKDGMFVWTDRQSPIPVRKFPTIQALMWEYELPQALKPYLEKL